MIKYDLFLAAKQAHRNQKYKKSISLYEQVLEVNPNESEVKLEYARTLTVILKTNNKAVQYENKIRELLNDVIGTERDLNAQYELAILEHTLGNLNEAYKSYSKVVKKYQRRKNQKDIEHNIFLYAVAGIVQIEISLGNIENAEKYIKILENSTYDKTNLMYIKITLLMKQKKYDEALLLCDIARKETDREDRFHKPIILIRQQRYAEALEYLKEMSDETSLNFVAKKYQYIIAILLKLEKYDEAEKYHNYLNSIYKNHRYGAATEFYIRYKKGQQIKSENLKSYTTRMLLNYDKEQVMEHIIQKHGKDIKINVEELYDIVTQKIAAGNHEINLEGIMEEHEIILPYIVGAERGKETNTVIAITFPNETKIITMYPIACVNKELDKLHQEEKQPQKTIQRESRIDRFRRRQAQAKK